MEQNAKHIDELRLKVEAKHSSALTDKEIESRAKEQQLKGTIKKQQSHHTFFFFLAYEERLQRQSADFERERKNLQELISRLEVHLSEQTKLVEEVFKSLSSPKHIHFFF
jgi:hypothetical protein